MLSQRPYLYNVFLDGRLELSNNRAERSVKPFVIGRNYVPENIMCSACLLQRQHESKHGIIAVQQ
jgi:hypothetical protein